MRIRGKIFVLWQISYSQKNLINASVRICIRLIRKVFRHITSEYSPVNSVQWAVITRSCQPGGPP